MEWIIVYGYRVSFFNPILNSSFQSPTGKGPEFASNSLYAGLLFTIIANDYQPYINIPIVTTGVSSKIKIYNFDYWTKNGFLILNKDTNSSASGIVAIKNTDTNGMSCIYLSASSLSATSGITINGVEFVGNNPNPVGNYTPHFYYVNLTGWYNIPLNYSQAVTCRSIKTTTYFWFPTAPFTYKD
jgi:hypothetical protein